MRTMPEVSLSVTKWNSAVGATGTLNPAWFRIRGIPFEKRTKSNASFVGSLVGLPLEVDSANMHKLDYVRVKIGCRDVTKVPAVVNGMLDFMFYDFIYQREVVQEGITNAAGNQWIRNSGNDDTNQDFPSPKKARLAENVGNNSKGVGNNSGAGYKGKQAANTASGSGISNEGISKMSETAVTKHLGHTIDTAIGLDKATPDGDSEDEGLKIGDLIAPDGEALNFGNFQANEIKKLWTVKLNESTSAVINEYGTNLYKSKFDPLAAIEAKNALFSKQDTITIVEPVNPENRDINRDFEKQVCTENVVQELLSPGTGTQEPPQGEFSSQEEVVLETIAQKVVVAEKESPNWTALEEESTEVEPYNRGNQIDEETYMEEICKQSIEEGKEGRRQSERIRKKGGATMKIAEQAELLAKKHNLEGLQPEVHKESLEQGAEKLKDSTGVSHAS